MCAIVSFQSVWHSDKQDKIILKNYFSYFFETLKLYEKSTFFSHQNQARCLANCSLKSQTVSGKTALSLF